MNRLRIASNSGEDEMKTEYKARGIYELYLKRLLDIICAVVTLAVFWWLYIILAVLVKIRLGSPILFKQERPGKSEKIFTLYKFRTMTDERDPSGELLPDEVRLTRFGKILRAMSLDELPEVFNILKGDMSIVGPRPLLVQYLPLYNDFQKRRHEVRSGLTGYAQVHGRNAITWEEKFRLDVYYVDHVSFLMDVKVILQTVKKVFTREGIHGANTETMEPFKGEYDERG